QMFWHVTLPNIKWGLIYGVVLCTARAMGEFGAVSVVDQALVSALQQGLLAGAVIDVCREEPLPAGHPFWDAPRLLLTGHSSAPTDPRLLVQLFVDNLRRWQAGHALRGHVDFV
ncbi:NAD(P)-dependent oxidoreductase, partial [Pseudomonas peli]|uniref:NAD(P)-dependent oxidoreductase n=1 Tax=Pseudomonas peli TaxID=592361 RepID=UPI003D31B777